MSIFNINKNGNIEVEHNIIRYRIPLTEFNTEDINDFEQDIKRKEHELKHNPLFLRPFQIEFINASVVYYYDVTSFKSFLSIRALDFKEKLKYFASLIEIAKTEGTVITWDKNNFVLDEYEETIKAIIYETDLMKIHEKTDAFEGLKELILISLTNLDSILTKPRKVNFLDQDNKIIEFAETVLLKIGDIDDLDDYIQTKLIEYDYDESIDLDIEEPVTTKKMTRSISKNPPIKKSKKSKKSKSKNSIPKSKGNRFNLTGKQIFMYGGLGILLVLGIILNMLGSGGETTKKDNNVDLTIEDILEENNQLSNLNPVSVKETEYDRELLLAYRYNLLNESQKSLAILESIGYDNLTEEDQYIMLNIYETNDQYEKSIALNPARAENIVSALVSADDTNRIIELAENLEYSNPFIEFEYAYLQGEMEKVIQLKDKVLLNGRRERQIMDAYIRLENLDQAKEFAEKRGNPDLTKMIPKNSW